MFGPHKRNLRGENNDFGGTNDLEFEGTKPGFWGDQTLILRGPTECLSLPNFHFLVNLGLHKYNNTPWAPPSKIQLHPLIPPISFGPPTMVAAVPDFKDRAITNTFRFSLCSRSLQTIGHFEGTMTLSKKGSHTKTDWRPQIWDWARPP